ncbi:RNA 2'-phosphotransferase [Streptomyces platensis]|uniref:RNA 2'-phosphotransferase n=1 Tax=Streptomyces platensis TaxID=58346 RepID=UPI002E12C272|nr:RNA 2'-phosphotransferase [Streptomyces platensis]
MISVYGRIALEYGLRISAMQEEWARWAADEVTSAKARKASELARAQHKGQEGQDEEVRPVDLDLPPAVPPAHLFHGTVARSVAAIREEGLRPMSRHAVHLSPDRETATRVGARRGKPVVLTVDAGAMHRAGHVFRVSANGVWLTSRVPAPFLRFPG